MANNQLSQLQEDFLRAFCQRQHRFFLTGGANEGNFFALDAATGKPLWEVQTGGGIRANPISFLIDGKQHVAIAEGQALFVFGL